MVLATAVDVVGAAVVVEAIVEVVCAAVVVGAAVVDGSCRCCWYWSVAKNLQCASVNQFDTFCAADIVVMKSICQHPLSFVTG